MLELLTDPNAWLAFATLATLEIVLGIDNLIFISILAGKLPADRQDLARKAGIAAALVSRLVLLFALTWIMKLTAPLFALFGNELSGKDLVLILGGVFLIYKATKEIHDKLEGASDAPGMVGAAKSFASVIVQIMFVDMVFSLDSIITAVGMVDELAIMVAAVVAAVVFMFAFAGAVQGFVDRHPTIKMLALAFLLVIGVALIADGLAFHIPKGYIYSAMAFAIAVEMLNIRLRRRGQPVQLHGPDVPSQSADDSAGDRQRVPLPAYVITDIEVLDPALFAEYVQKVPATVAAHGGRYLARGGAIHVLEGAWSPTRCAILQFPDMEHFRAWWSSPEYDALRPLRQKAARSNLVVTQGV